MPSRIEKMMPYMREMEAYKKMKVAEGEELSKVIKNYIDVHAGGRTSLSSMLSLAKKDNPTGGEDGVYAQMFNPDIKDKEGYLDQFIPYSSIPEDSRDQIRQDVGSKVGSDIDSLKDNYNQKPYSYAAAIPAELAAGANSLWTAPLDLWNMGVAGINQWLGDENKGFDSLGESWGEKASRVVKTAIGSGAAKTAAQRYTDTAANFAGGMLGGGSVLKALKFGIGGAWRLGGAGYNAIRGITNPVVKHGAESAKAQSLLKNIKLQDVINGGKFAGKHTALGAGLGLGSQYMDENDYPAAGKLAALLGGGYLGNKFIAKDALKYFKPSHYGQKIPSKGTINDNNEIIRQELQKLSGIDKINYNSKGINKYAEKGSQSFKDVTKNIMKEASGRYDHILDDFEMPPEMQKQLRDNLKYTNIKVPTETGKKVKIQDYLTPEGNFGLKEILEHSEKGVKKTGKTIIDQSILNNPDIEYMSLRDLDNLSSNLKKMKKKGNNHYNLNKDIKLIDEDLNTLLGNKPMQEVRSNYKQAVQQVTPMNNLNKPIEANKQSTDQLINSFIRQMSDHDIIQAYKPLINAGLDADALHKIGQTVPRSKEFLYGLDSDIGKVKSKKIINPEDLSKFGVLGGKNMPKFMNMQKAFAHLDDMPNVESTLEAGKVKDIVKSPKVLTRILRGMFGNNINEDVQSILKKGNPKTIGDNFKSPTPYVYGSKIAEDQAQSYVDENHRYGKNEYNQYLRKTLRNMENARNN